MRRIPSGRLLLVASVLAAVWGRSAPAATQLSLSAPTLSAGREAEASVAKGTLPEEAEEVELVLSLDGGRTYPVRLTPALSPRDTLRFSVPAIPAARAWIALRYGTAGEDEILAALSGPIELRLDSLALERLVSSGGELWTHAAACVGAPLPSPALQESAVSPEGADDELDAPELPLRDTRSFDDAPSLAAVPGASLTPSALLSDTTPRVSLPKRE